MNTKVIKLIMNLLISVVIILSIMIIDNTVLSYAGTEEFTVTYMDYPENFEKEYEEEEARTKDIKEHGNINLAVGASLKILYFCGDSDHDWII